MADMIVRGRLCVGTPVCASYTDFGFYSGHIRSVQCKVIVGVEYLDPYFCLFGEFKFPEGNVQGPLEVGGTVLVDHPETHFPVEAIVQWVDDLSEYTITCSAGDRIIMSRQELHLTERYCSSPNDYEHFDDSPLGDGDSWPYDIYSMVIEVDPEFIKYLSEPLQPEVVQRKVVAVPFKNLEIKDAYWENDDFLGGTGCDFLYDMDYPQEKYMEMNLVQRVKRLMGRLGVPFDFRPIIINNQIVRMSVLYNAIRKVRNYRSQPLSNIEWEDVVMEIGIFRPNVETIDVLKAVYWKYLREFEELYYPLLKCPDDPPRNIDWSCSRPFYSGLLYKKSWIRNRRALKLSRKGIAEPISESP